MEFTFIPKRLKQAQKEVAVFHKTQRELTIRPTDDKLKALIYSVIALDDTALAIRAISLSDQEVAWIAGYLPYNYYKVNMWNLFRIFASRSKKKFCAILYDQWQNSYDNVSCNNFIHSLLKDDKNFQDVITEKHLNVGKLDNIIQYQNIVYGIGKEIQEYPLSEKRTLAEKFAFFGIHKNSRLYKDCADAFYTYCGEADYQEADGEVLLECVKNYQKRNKPLLKLFLNNFISKLDLEDLDKFQNLARYFEADIGDAQKGKSEYGFLFIDMPENLIEKYMDWINACRIEQYFRCDDDKERSEFWKQYRFVRVQRFDNSAAVVMEFKEYVAVEFLGKAAGPIYFYPKEYYNSTLKFLFPAFENQQMTKYLYNQSKYDKKKDRFEHKGEIWKDKVESYIIQHHITRKVFA